MPPLYKRRQVREGTDRSSMVAERYGMRISLGATFEVPDANAVAQETAGVAQNLQVLHFVFPLTVKRSAASIRQLCIYKGIHPRVPKKSRRDARVFYHNKDIKFMAHEPSIVVLRRAEIFRCAEAHVWQCRKQRQSLRKIRAAERRRDGTEAKRLRRKFPKLSLSHILKERSIFGLFVIRVGFSVQVPDIPTCIARFG